MIEVISPESVIRDTEDKFEEYETAGVREYWLISPNRRTAGSYDYDENRKYFRFRRLGKFESRVISGFWIDVDWLWQDELPNLIEVSKEWKLV